MSDMVDFLSYEDPFEQADNSTDTMTVSCRHCKKSGLQWFFDDSTMKWRLYDKLLHVHTCNEYYTQGDQL